MGKKSRAKKATAPVGGSRSAESAGLIQLIRQLLENRQNNEAMRAAITLVEQDPLNPLAHTILGSLLGQMERPLDAIRHFELAVRLGMTSDVELFREFAMTASMAQLPIHALGAARTGVRLEATPEHRELFQSVITTTEAYLKQIIGNSGVDLGVAERAMLLVEGSTRALQANDADRARQRAIEATQAAPAIPLTWNNLAMLHWAFGETSEAIAACEAGIAALDHDHPLLLSTLVRLQTCTGQGEAARESLTRLTSLPLSDEMTTVELAKGYAALDNDQDVYDTLSGLQGENLFPVARFLLGVAAANLGKRDEARSQWRNLAREGLPQVRHYSEIMARNEKPSTPDGRFPYFSAAELVPTTVLENLFMAVQQNADEAGVAEAAAQYPNLPVALCETLIAPAIDPRLAVELLLRLPEAAGAAAVARYAGSRMPGDYDRLFAQIALRGTGAEPTGTPVSLWLGGRRREYDVPALHLQMPAAPAYTEEVGPLMQEAGEAQQQNNSTNAVEIYSRVLELDPSLQEAEHNLGTALLLSEQMAEGEAHLRRSLELDGDYALARCNLASLELSRGNVAAAAELLEPLNTRRDFTVEEVIAYLRTRSDVLRAQGDLSQAEMLLHCLLAFDHENALARERLASLGAVAPALAG